MNALIMVCKFLVNKVRTDSPNWGDTKLPQRATEEQTQITCENVYKNVGKEYVKLFRIYMLMGNGKFSDHNHVLGRGTDRAFF